MSGQIMIKALGGERRRQAGGSGAKIQFATFTRVFVSTYELRLGDKVFTELLKTTEKKGGSWRRVDAPSTYQLNKEITQRAVFLENEGNLQS